MVAACHSVNINDGNPQGRFILEARVVPAIVVRALLSHDLELGEISQWDVIKTE